MSKHVIFSRNNDNGVLTTERIRQLAPAVFATTKREGLSDRYAPLHTAELLPVLADYGYQPVQAAQKRSRTTSVDHSMHMLAFAKANDMGDGGLRSEVVLYNSHDGTGAVRLFAGAFRFICSNGIVAGDGFQSRTYHNRSAMLSFEEVLRNTIDGLPRMMEQIELMRNTVLDTEQALTMAERSVLTRWDKYNGTPKRGVYALESTANDVLKVQRIGDEGIDAWTVFNRIQEGVIRGNAMIKSIVDVDNNPNGVLRKARPVASIREHQRINAALWDIATEVVA
jgi:hypothetical protein